MKVYQLRLRDLGLLLEPVFKDEESAILFKSKYTNRCIDIEENILDSKADYVYRIKSLDSDGYELLDNLFTDVNCSLDYIKNSSLDNCTVVKESILSNSNFEYSLIEV